MKNDNYYTILSVSISDEREEIISDICKELSISFIATRDKMETLEYLMDNKINIIIVNTDIGKEESIELLEIITHDAENSTTPIIVISALSESDSVADGMCDFNVISIFSHSKWQIQLKNLLKFMQSQKIHTVTLKNELVESEVRNVIDHLTGGLNRYGAEDKFQHLASRYKAYAEPFSAIMLDIDHFKHVNDTYGHDIGDEALISISSIIKGLIRDTDAFIRFGGEEFVIFVSNAKIDVAIKIAEKLRKSIEETLHSSKKLKITSSFGVAEYVENEELESLNKKIDKLLYIAKDTGRNRVISTLDLETLNF